MDAQTEDDRRTDWSVVPVALAFGLGLGAAGWWFTREEPPETASAGGAAQVRLAAAAQAGLPGLGALTPAGTASGALGPLAMSPPAAGGVQPVMGTAAVALRADEGGPVVPPVRERPAIVSPSEWDALSAAASQAAHPDEELAHLINQLRFRKLMDAWHGSPQNMPGGLSDRARAARSLLDDLVPRLAMGDVDVAEARRLLPDLLADAVPNPTERTQRAQLLANAINQVQSAGSGHPQANAGMPAMFAASQAEP
jgi:hypothetical protein